MELFQFGVVADVQYADKDNIRDCRFDSALAVITRSVFALNRCEALEFVVQLGDLIDGNRSVESTKVDANAVMDVFQNLHWPLKHVIGNHCRRLPLSYLTKLLNLPPCAYHVFQPHPQWRVVVLNGAENYVEAVDRTDAEVTLVREICRRTGADLIPWNGAIGSDQIAWFRSQLQASRSLGENVIVLCHFPLVKEAAASTHVLLNAEEILDVMDEFPGVICLYMSGHYHKGGYAVRKEVPHVTVEAVVESQADHAHATVHVFSDGSINVRGHGGVTSRNIPRFRTK